MTIFFPRQRPVEDLSRYKVRFSEQERATSTPTEKVEASYELCIVAMGGFLKHRRSLTTLDSLDTA